MRRAFRSKKITAIVLALLVMVCTSSAASIRNAVFVKVNGKKDRTQQLTQSVQSGASQLFVKQAYASLPLMFEANEGQVDPQVRFIARSGGQTIFITSQETVIVARSRPPVEKGKLPD